MTRNYPVPPSLPRSFSNHFYLEDEALIDEVQVVDDDYSYLEFENVIIRRSFLEKVTL